jgi:hypothetical protein
LLAFMEKLRLCPKAVVFPQCAQLAMPIDPSARKSSSGQTGRMLPQVESTEGLHEQ